MFCRAIHKDREKISGKCFVQFIFYHGVRALTYSTSTKWGKSHDLLYFLTTCDFPPTFLTLRDFELNEITISSSSYDRSHVFIHKQKNVWINCHRFLTCSQVLFIRIKGLFWGQAILCQRQFFYHLMIVCLGNLQEFNYLGIVHSRT